MNSRVACRQRARARASSARRRGRLETAEGLVQHHQPGARRAPRPRPRRTRWPSPPDSSAPPSPSGVCSPTGSRASTSSRSASSTAAPTGRDRVGRPRSAGSPAASGSTGRRPDSTHTVCAPQRAPASRPASGSPVDQHLPGGGLVPAQQQAGQAALARARRADHRHVRARRRARRSSTVSMSWPATRTTVACIRISTPARRGGGRRRMPPGAAAARVRLGRAQQLDQAQGDVAVLRVLLDEEPDLLAQRRQGQRPVDQQQRPARPRRASPGSRTAARRPGRTRPAPASPPRPRRCGRRPRRRAPTPPAARRARAPGPPRRRARGWPPAPAAHRGRSGPGRRRGCACAGRARPAPAGTAAAGTTIAAGQRQGDGGAGRVQPDDPRGGDHQLGHGPHQLAALAGQAAAASAPGGPARPCRRPVRLWK